MQAVLETAFFIVLNRGLAFSLEPEGIRKIASSPPGKIGLCFNTVIVTIKELLMSDPSLLDHNARAWDKQAQTESPRSLPVSSEQVEQARRGQWQVHLLPSPVPADWLSGVQGKSVLCLASAGGQQAPILAAAGASVTVFDLSAGQLDKDRMVAERDGLSLQIEQGDMCDLSRFGRREF